MFRLLRKLIWLVVVLAILWFGSNWLWPDWWQKDFVPPLPIIGNDCESIETEIKKYDWDSDTAIAIMKAESSCNAEAKGDMDLTYHEDGRDYGYSVGAFQVRILPGREGCDSYNVGVNVKCAYDIYKDAGWGAWSMYTNGAYKKYKWRGIGELF